MFDLKQISKENQIEDYRSKIAILSLENKIQIIKEVISDPYKFINYNNIFSELLYDLASNTPEYYQILELIASKFNKDLAYANLFEPLIKVGKERKDIALFLFNKIMCNPDNDELKCLGGHLLGGIYLGNKKELVTYLQERTEETNPHVILAYVRSLRIVYRESTIDDSFFKLIDVYRAKNFEISNLELIHLSFDKYSKNPQRFFNLIRLLLECNPNKYAHTVFYRLLYLDYFLDEHFFALIDIGKTSENTTVLKDICSCFIKYPSHASQIMDCIFFWIKKNKIFWISLVDHVLDELSKKEKNFIVEYIKRYSALSLEYGYPFPPPMFQSLLHDTAEDALEVIEDIKCTNRIEELAKLTLLREILQYCYKDIAHLPTLKELAIHLHVEFSNTPYTECRFNARIFKQSTINKDQYHELIDEINTFIEALIYGRRSFDFKEIFENLDNYKNIKKYAQSILQECQIKKKYSPLLWMLEYNNTDAVVTNRSDKGWGKAYLFELENGLPIFERTPNDKYPTQSMREKHIKDSLSNTDRFWTFITELLLLNKIGPDSIICLSKQFNYKSDIDVIVAFGSKVLLLEITFPDTHRELKLMDSASKLKSKTYSVIDKKYKQFMKSGAYKEIENSDNNLFFVVIDGSQVPLFGVDVSEATDGPLSLTVKINNSTHEIVDEKLFFNYKESIWPQNDKFKYISGIICFKRLPVQNCEGTWYIGLEGIIISNPKGKNILSPSEVILLSQKLFVKELDMEFCKTD
ncbi:MAG: hypothetical protein QME57_04140 [Patescibacteria group bacterium]|nr:hypothetical protein [Patescibacteria group bacterium]